ncbi:MAG: NAD(P)H-quinone oxidoreductase [Gammaproteobacteria bacterium]|nr:NAD(P)H-quinone oxidoreductase [Gammaproteobacteria bacterium]
MKIPSSMYFINLEKNSKNMYLATSPIPTFRSNEILIRVEAAGISRADVAQRRGQYNPPPDASTILGLDVAGVVVAKGDAVTALKLGDKVCALTNGGGYAEYCVAPATQCLPWPENYDAIHAAALPENFFTVWTNVFQQGYLRKSESLLVHGGTSGIGLTAIQLAKEFAGKIYATAGSQKKCQACLDYGADIAINYREENFETVILQVTKNGGVDVILDIVGAAYFEKNIHCLAINGRLIEIGLLQGSKVERFNLATLLTKRLTIMGSTLRARSTKEKALIAESLYKTVWPVLNQGRCKPIIDTIFPLSKAAEAHELMESSQHIGKIILVPD